MSTPRIEFSYQTPFRIANRIKLKSFILRLFAREGCKLENLHYIFCSDSYLLKLNREFLNHNTLADILTFNFNEPSQAVQGEIYISVERIRENAKKFQVSLKNELQRVMIHGALHLCGYDDRSKSAKSLMREKEEEYLKRVPRGI